MENDTSKSKFNSLTIQGSLVGILPAVYAIAKTFGLDLPDGSVEAIVNGVMAVMAIASVVMTYIGRHRAKQPIK